MAKGSKLLSLYISCCENRTSITDSEGENRVTETGRIKRAKKKPTKDSLP